MISGAKAIGAAIGINWQRVPHYVKEYGLPAFRIEEKGNWMALPEDLRSWAIRMRDARLGKA